MMHHTTTMVVKKVIPFFTLLLVLSFTSVTAAPFQSRTNTEEEDFQGDIKAFQQNMRAEMHTKMKNQQRLKMQDKMSGVPDSLLTLQSNEPVQMPSLDEAIVLALKAATKAATDLIDTDFHKNGKKIVVPDNYKTIQEAINIANSGDTIVVNPGIYYEQLVMKDGVKLVSDSSNHGDELVTIPDAHIKLPKRTLRTIIDGSKSKLSKHGMVDFDPGVGRKTIIDGFTIQNLPLQNHHIPGHAHGLNVRGASPIIANCLIQNMGSTGIGSHVVYNDQDKRVPDRDFRWANVKHQASAVLYNNIIHSSVGLGIGCNHFSSPFILGNEVYKNSDAVLGEAPTPGIGNKHGSFATIIGNIVHDNPGGGIMAQKGALQGRHGVDRPTHPTISNNVVFDNGNKKPGISCQNTGSLETPIIINGNHVYRASSVGIGLSRNSVGIIEDNMVMHSKYPNITINGSIALKLNRNKVLGLGNAPGITIVNRSVVNEMIGNAVENGESQRFKVEKNSEVKEVESRKK